MRGDSSEQDYILHVDASEMRRDPQLLRRVWSHWEASEPVVISGVVPGMSWDPKVRWEYYWLFSHACHNCGHIDAADGIAQVLTYSQA